MPRSQFNDMEGLFNFNDKDDGPCRVESLPNAAPTQMPDGLEKLLPVYRDCQNHGTYELPPTMIDSRLQGASDSRMGAAFQPSARRDCHGFTFSFRRVF